MGQGYAPLIEVPALSRRIGARLYLKFEGMNLTTSFKDRGMMVALSRAVASDDRACVCASTGNTAAAASAYLARAGISCFVVVPVGKSVLAIWFRLSDLREASLLASEASRDLVTATD